MSKTYWGLDLSDKWTQSRLYVRPGIAGMTYTDCRVDDLMTSLNVDTTVS
jgi:hypothetical protein